MKYLHVLAVLSVVLMTSISLSAQRRVIQPILSSELGLSNDVRVMTMDRIDKTKLIAEDSLRYIGTERMRFAYPIKTEIDIIQLGTRTVLENGVIYRLSIDCPTADNINFLYNQFYIPVGAHLHIYNSDKSEVIGAFTSLNNTRNEQFATAVINDERATLEYFEPSEVHGRGRVSIGQVGYGYRPFVALRSSARGPGDSGSCQVDINCVPEGNNWQDEKKGVGRITLNGSDWCSGCMVRTVEDDCAPLFLTADHCLPSGKDAITDPDLSSFVFYFNYEYPGCGSGTANLSETVSGATLLANDSPSDFAILELTENPLDAGYDIYFAGWDARDQTPVSGGVGIHHPSGDAKKIATHNVVPTSTGWGGSNDGSHWEVYWLATTNGHSVTEGGSSGSPIFDSNSRILGQLHGGSSINCTDPANDPGIYGKLSYSWMNNGATDDRRKLQPWLDPTNTGTLFMDGTYPVACANNKIQFRQASTQVQERNDCDTVVIQLPVDIVAAPSASVTVDVSVVGSATEGVDYEVSPATLTFPAGASTSQKVYISIYADGYVEGDEDIILELENVNSADTLVSIGANAIHTINVVNDDFIPSPEASGDYLVGAGALSASGSYTPFRGYWHDARYQIIYRASDLLAAGMQAGEITAISFDVVTKGSTQPYTGFTVGMKHTSTDAYSSNDFESGFTEVFAADVTTVVGQNTITFTTPFVWNGTSNLMLQTCFDNTSYTQNDIVKYDLVGYNVERAQWVDNQVGCDLTGISSYEARPQILFTIDAGSSIQTSVNSNAGYAELPLGPNETVHFYDDLTGNVMATIENLSAHDFGCTRVEVDRAGVDATSWFAGNMVTNKTFFIDPEFPNANASVEVTLFYDSTELVTFIPDISAMSRSDLDISDPGNSLGNTNHEAVTQQNFGPHSSYTATFDSGLGGFALSNVISGPCPDTLDLSGVINTNETFKASNAVRTNGLTIIQNGASIFFEAGNFVELNEEFELVLGAELTVRIQVCN